MFIVILAPAAVVHAAETRFIVVKRSLFSQNLKPKANLKEETLHLLVGLIELKGVQKLLLLLRCKVDLKTP